MFKPQRAQRSQRFLFFIFVCVAFVAVQNAFAQDESEEATEQPAEIGTNTYSPDHCEFTITFPEAPYKSRRCEEGGEERCYEQISYTQVYEMSATVNFRVICNPVDESLYKDYSPEVMAATLRAMTKKSVVSEYNIDFREDEDYKQAGLVGAGQAGQMPTIFIAQLWIGKQSALSVEAELIGEAHDTADKLFSDILKSVQYSGIKEIEKPEAVQQPDEN